MSIEMPYYLLVKYFTLWKKGQWDVVYWKHIVISEVCMGLLLVKQSPGCFRFKAFFMITWLAETPNSLRNDLGILSVRKCLFIWMHGNVSLLTKIGNSFACCKRQVTVWLTSQCRDVCNPYIPGHKATPLWKWPILARIWWRQENAFVSNHRLQNG